MEITLASVKVRCAPRNRIQALALVWMHCATQRQPARLVPPQKVFRFCSNGRSDAAIADARDAALSSLFACARERIVVGARRADLLKGCANGVGHHSPARPERLVVFDGGITRRLMLDRRVELRAE
jgi:hypothetical protein